VKRGLAWLAFGLATLFGAYWAYLNGFQVITVITWATRADAPNGVWVLTGLYGLHVIAACVAWYLGLRALGSGRLVRGVGLGILTAIASWPWLALLYVRFVGS
jgi:hypothetical protein